MEQGSHVRDSVLGKSGDRVISVISAVLGLRFDKSGFSFGWFPSASFDSSLFRSAANM